MIFDVGNHHQKEAQRDHEDEDQQLKASHARPACGNACSILLAEQGGDIHLAGGNLPDHYKSDNRDKPANDVSRQQLKDDKGLRVVRHYVLLSDVEATAALSVKLAAQIERVAAAKQQQPCLRNVGQSLWTLPDMGSVLDGDRQGGDEKLHSPGAYKSRAGSRGSFNQSTCTQLPGQKPQHHN